MKTIRSCCGCTTLLILLLLSACFVLAWLILSTRTVRAQADGGCTSAMQAPPEQAIQIVEGISAPTLSKIARGAFFERRLTVTLRGGECVALASTPNGRGPIWVDDEVRMEIMRPDGSTRSWSYDFRNADRTQVVPTAPQELPMLFTRGEHHVRVILQDLSPTVFGASSLWLVVFATATPMPTTMPSPSATTTPSPMPTLSPSATLRVEGTPLPELPTAVPTPVAIITKSSDPMPLVATAAGLGVFALVIAAVAVRRMQRPSPPVLPIYSGMLNLFDTQSLEVLSVELPDSVHHETTLARVAHRP